MKRTIIVYIGESILDVLEQAPNRRYEVDEIFRSFNSGRYPSQREETMAQEDMIFFLQEVWEPSPTGRYEPGMEQRQHSPAEIASLSLLDIVDTDQVILLRPDNPRGVFCANLIENVLRNEELRGKPGYPDCGENLIVKDIKDVVERFTIFDFTGAPKREIPHVCSIAMRLNAEIICLEEDRSGLIRYLYS